MRLTMRSALVLLVPLGIFVALPAASETKEWDQAAVTALAKQLAAVAGDLRSSVREPSEAHSGRRQRRWRVQRRTVHGSRLRWRSPVLQES